MSVDPLRTARLGAVALSVAFAIAAAGVGLNALIHEHKDIDHLKGLAPAPVRVDIDVSDIDTAGKIATIANVVLAVFGAIILLLTVLPKFRVLSIKTLKLQALALLVPLLVVIGGMIPYMIFFVNRKVGVKAFIGTQQLPQSMVDQVKARSGAEDTYKKIWYLRLLAIFPWISILFGIIAVAVVFLSASRASVDRSAAPVSPVRDSASSDKGSSAHHEKTATNNA